MTGRLRAYRWILYLAVALLIAGGATSTAGHRLVTAGLYLAFGALVIGLQAVLLRGGRVRSSLWPAIVGLDVLAHGIVVARMGGTESPYLLLLALPPLAWGVQRGIAAGALAALGAGASYGIVLLSAVTGHGRPGPGVDVTPIVPLLGFRATALGLLGAFSGLLGRRISQDEALHRRMRRELEQAQLDAESILSHLSRGLLCVDPEGRVTRLNSHATALLGRFGGWEPGVSLHELPGDDLLAPLASKLRERLFESRERTVEVVLGPGSAGDPSSRPLPLEVATTPVIDREGRPHGMIVILSDMTERRAREAEERRRERLALIGQLSAGLAHEVRNSLKPITGSVELLRAEFPPGDGPRDTLMEIVLREAESLENFLTEFLSFARDRSLRMEKIPLEKLLGEELESLNALPNGPFRLIREDPVDPPAYVRADRSALRQVVRNLGMNALEAGGGQIEVGWKRVGGEAVIFVRDHGPGIPSEIRSKVCEPFFTTKVHGTGLGLAIARDLTDRMNGTLRLEEAEGGGTRACVRLPLAESADSTGMEHPDRLLAARAA